MELESLVDFDTHLLRMEELTPDEYAEIKKRLKIRDTTFSKIADDLSMSVPQVTKAAQNKAHGAKSDSVKLHIVNLVGEKNWNPYVVPRGKSHEKRQIHALRNKPGTGVKGGRR